jgi:hypothetical protein
MVIEVHSVAVTLFPRGVNWRMVILLGLLLVDALVLCNFFEAGVLLLLEELL